MNFELWKNKIQAIISLTIKFSTYFMKISCQKYINDFFDNSKELLLCILMNK